MSARASSAAAKAATETPPSKAKETHEDKALRLKKRALELRSRGLRLNIIACIGKHECTLQGVADHLRDVGAMYANFEVIEPTGDNATSKGSKRKSQAETAKVVNNNFTKLTNMPLNRVQGWLQKMEPVVFSDNNSKSIIVRGQLQALTWGGSSDVCCGAAATFERGVWEGFCGGWSF